MEEIGLDGEDFFDRGPRERIGEDADEAFDGRGFGGHVGIDLYLTACDLDPEEDRRLAFVDAMFAALLLGLKSRGKRRQSFGEFQEQLQPLARLKAGEFIDDAIELGGGCGHVAIIVARDSVAEITPRPSARTLTLEESGVLL